MFWFHPNEGIRILSLNAPQKSSLEWTGWNNGRHGTYQNNNNNNGRNGYLIPNWIPINQNGALSTYCEALLIRLGCCCSVALEIQGYLTLRCSLKLTPRIHSIRASFCPLLSLEKGEYIGSYVKILLVFTFMVWRAFPKCWVSKCVTSLKRK